MLPRINYDDGEPIGVYALISPSGKVYVGMTCDSFERRWKAHEKDLRAERHRAPGLQYTYNKYGWSNIGKVMLQIWEKPGTLEGLLELEKEILLQERYWWEVFKSEGTVMLHGCPSGTGSVLHSEDTKEKLRNTRKEAAEKMRFSDEEKMALLERISDCQSWEEVKPITGFNRKALLRRGFTKEELSTIPFVAKRFAIPDYETMYDLYVTQQLTTREVGEHIGRKHPAVLRILKLHGITTRKGSEAQALYFDRVKKAKSIEMRKCAVCDGDYPVAERPRGSTCSKSCQGKYRKTLSQTSQEPLYGPETPHTSTDKAAA